jgi:hypothetical protein
MTSGKKRFEPLTALVFAICVSALIASALALNVFYPWLFAGYAIGVAVHELGHLTFAAIASIAVHRIVIGAGPLLWRSRIGKTWLEVRVLPFSGHVEAYPVLNYRWYRWALFLLGGVMGNLAVIGIVFGLYAIGFAGRADILGPVVFVQAIFIVGNIVPFTGELGPSDGMGLLRTLLLRSPPDRAAQAELCEAYKAAMSRYGPGNMPFTMTAASPRLLRHFVGSAFGGNIRGEIEEELRHELRCGDLAREERIWVLDALITRGLVYGEPAARLHLDDWSRQALALAPDLLTLQGSRGAVLVELGRYEEGRALLTPLAAPDQPASFDSFMSRASLAIAEHRLGSEAAARQLADAARATAEATGTTSHMTAMLVRLDRAIPPAHLLRPPRRNHAV